MNRLNVAYGTALIFMMTVGIQNNNSAHAQQQQQPPTARERALEATADELKQAWVASRTLWIAAQDENARLTAELKNANDQIAHMKAEKALPAQPTEK